MTDPWTKGPWGIRGGIEIWIKAGALHVATIPRAGDGDWSTANANLIAAAPELAEALDALLNLEDNTSPFGGEMQADRVERTFFSARAALAKARGETDG